MPPFPSLAVTPQLVAHPKLGVLADVANESGRWAIEPKVDGIRGLLVYVPDGTIETRNRKGRTTWLAAPPLVRDGRADRGSSGLAPATMAANEERPG